MKFETISVTTDSRGTATLTLTRATHHNALSPTMIAELTDAARIVGSDPSIRSVVLTGEGGSFCAGGDLGWMKAQFAASRQQRIGEARKLALMLRTLLMLPKPLIGRIQGQAFGGGVGLISVCDVAVAVRGARFGLTETRLGLIPATIGPYVVARMRHADARRIVMSGRIFDASEARDLGLVHAIVADEDLNEAVEAEVQLYLAAAPGAVAAAKALVHALGPQIDDIVINKTVAWLADIWETPEAHEGVAAFFEKRPPCWSV